MDEFYDDKTGESFYQCNDTSYCLSRMNKNAALKEEEPDEQLGTAGIVG